MEEISFERAEQLKEKAHRYMKMSDDLRAQSAQMVYELKYGNKNHPVSTQSKHS